MQGIQRSAAATGREGGKLLHQPRWTSAEAQAKEEARPAGHGEALAATALPRQGAIAAAAELPSEFPAAKGGSSEENERAYGATGKGDRPDLLPSGRGRAVLATGYHQDGLVADKGRRLRRAI